jgi:O-methyltransferase
MFLKIISKLRFLHTVASYFVSILPFFIIHNFSKYHELRKTLKIIEMDETDGDYCEFGCFTGASLTHSLRITSGKEFFKKKIFYGFDSFEGFPEEAHKIYKSEDFSADYDEVKKIEKNSKGRCKIIKGFFEESLTDNLIKEKINKISLAFIDCDLALSSIPVFSFIKSRLVNGSFIIIDDYFNIDKNGRSIRAEFLKTFAIDKEIFLFSTYGLGGVVFRYYSS